jgi:4-aminobutyrate aminotransferase / (S)-3-amino-2-methylpropionate transaminase / 5-aminovalerate transaminase
LGARIQDRLLSLKEVCSAVASVRGLGAMLAVELVERGRPTEPATTLAADVVAACLERGVLLITAGPLGNVIRILSPLVITDGELDRALDILEEELLRLAGELPADDVYAEVGGGRTN